VARVTAIRSAAAPPAGAPSAAVPPAPAQPAAVLSARYRRALNIAVVIVVAGWQVAGAGSQLAADRADYHSFSVQVAIWLVLTAVIAAGSVRLLRGGSGWRGAWALAAVALVAGTAAAAACPSADMLKTDWAWGTVGWVGVLVLLRRPFAELAGFLSLAALATLALLARDGLHRAELAAFITVLAGSASIQFAVAVTARVLELVARQAADAAAAEAAARERDVIARRVHAARHARWLALQATAAPLLRALAAGTADPGDEALRRSCAVEAARLRRMIAETDDALSPLVHELHAAADIAERRGVAVDVETAGTLPAVPREIRRVITDAAITVLVAARTRARVTLTGTGAGIAVSLVADAPPSRLPAGDGEVIFEQQHDGDDLWVEARWNGR
jgi:hypothetical protein